jgi:hypothetical protein
MFGGFHGSYVSSQGFLVSTTTLYGFKPQKDVVGSLPYKHCLSLSVIIAVKFSVNLTPCHANYVLFAHFNLRIAKLLIQIVIKTEQ